MRERRAQIVLLVRSFEEADPDGLLIPLDRRTAATTRAVLVTGLADWQGDLLSARNVRNGETITRRSRLLFDALRHRIPAVHGVLRVARLGAGTAPAVILGALLVGLSTNVLGSQREINLLSFPLLGILGWNLLVYAVLAAGGLYRLAHAREAAGVPRPAGRLAELLLKGALWRRLHGWRFPDGAAAEARVISKAFVRFGALWHRLASALLAARVRRMLHVGAMALALGAVGGIYVRGLAFEYRATWESTLLDAPQIQTLLEALLGPAAALLGIDVPDVAPLRNGQGSARDWLHLYGLTAVLVVVLPRALLAGLESWRCRRLAANVPVDLRDPYFRRLFHDWSGAPRGVDVLPYSVTLETPALDYITNYLREFFGARTEIRVHPQVPYGETPEKALQALPHGTADAHPDLQGCVAALFNLAQTPEVEVHGAFLERLKTRLDLERMQLLVLLEAGAYRRRVGSEERIAERRDAWARMLREIGLRCTVVDESITADDDALAELGSTLWPRREPAGAG